MSALERALIFGYEPPGPVAAAFLQDTENSLVGIMGPYGSGKTSVIPVKGQLIARLQPPSKHDGVIRSKGYVIRQTYRQLWDKTIPSWKQVFPVTKDWPLEGAKNGPATHILRWREEVLRGVSKYVQTYEMQVEFAALGDADIDEFTRGLLATWIWLNEADTISGDAVGPLFGRLGRYPPPHELPDNAEPGFGALMCDFNAPNTSNWTWEKFFVNPDPGTKVYVQPGGREPNAENPTLRKLRPRYYHELAEKMEDWQVARFIDNKVGYSRSGQPVYPTFSPDRHVSKEQLRPWRGRPILLGGDGGNDAAMVLGQGNWDGRAHVLQSIVTPDGHKTDAETIGERVREILAGEYPHWPAVGVLDPACFIVDNRMRDGLSWADYFMRASGVPCIPAPTNKIGPRLRAVRKLLDRTIGAAPALQIDGLRNSTLVEGFTAGYRVKKIRGGEDTKFAEDPEKNHFSHVHDAMQYFALLLGMQGEAVDEMIELQADRNRAIRGDSGRGAVLNDW